MNTERSPRTGRTRVARESGVTLHRVALAARYERLSVVHFDVYADLDHLYMLNFSVDADRLAALVPEPLRVLQLRGRGFPSIVLPSIKRLRPVLTRCPAVDYELCGLRILVEHRSSTRGVTKGIYFARLVMDPDRVRRVANLVTPFAFERGTISKRRRSEAAAATTAPDRGPQHECDIAVTLGDEPFLEANVRVEATFPEDVPAGSAFASAAEALATYNDISYGFIPSPSGDRVQVLQIADPHPNYVAWPLVSLSVGHATVRILHESAALAGGEIALEPSYFVGELPRYWRWRPTERATDAVSAAIAVADRTAPS